MITTVLMGGLGNNLFEICAVLGYSLKYNVDYCIPTKITNPHYEGQEVFYSPNINYCDELPKGIKCYYNEPFFHYQEIPKSDCDCLVLNGYFQSFRYIDSYRQEILKALNFKWDQKPNWVSIHYRATNYRKFPNHHPVISEDYIEKAIFYFAEKGYGQFKVFSDEIGEIEKILSQDKYKFAAFKFEYINSGSEINDLQLMSECEHQICANSSYSLWGAWLNQNPDKVIIMPRNWFGESLKHDTKDLYIQGSLIL